MGKYGKYEFNPNLSKDNLTVSMKQFKEVTKLNEELTAENSRLIKENDNLLAKNQDLFNDIRGQEEQEEKHKDIINLQKSKIKRLENSVREEVENYSRIITQNAEYSIELQQIKSTRLYKFFKWLGVW